MERVLQFHIADYIVLALFLLISTAIGIYYGLCKSQRTTEEYLLGGRKMHPLPVALSLMVTYQSAISVLGVPTEVYIYSIMIVYGFVAIMLTNVFQAFILVPLLHPLKLTSTYEYLGRRFNSRAVQLLGTYMGMLQTLLYMAIVLLAPALALEAVVDLPLWLSIVLIGVLGTVYTSIGGIRTVIWTDVFQFIILFGGLIVIIVLGTINVGGLAKVFEVSKEGSRLTLNTISVDPRVRHTVWGFLTAGFVNWLPNCCNQSAVQRISSMRTERDAKLSTFLNVPLVILYGLILIYIGLLLYTHYAIMQCDPWSAEFVGNPNQLVPYYVMNVFRDIPGMTGLFIAALFSGALSTLSSGINAMSANTIQDILVNILGNASEFKKTLVAKLVVLLYGVMAIGLAYLARTLSGPVTQMSWTALGATGGPVVGVMFLGATFPQANWIGAFIGGITGIGMAMWLAVCQLLYGIKAPVSEKITTSGCTSHNAWEIDVYNHTFSTPVVYNTVTPLATETFANETSVPHDDHLVFYDISYLYVGIFGFIVSFVIGLIISLFTGMDRDDPTEAEYIFPCLRAFWKKGYTIVRQPKAYTATKTKLKTLENMGLPAYVAPIKSLDLSWYNRHSDDELYYRIGIPVHVEHFLIRISILKETCIYMYSVSFPL